MNVTREPVILWQAFIAPILMAATLLLGLDENTTGVIQAVILAITGVIAAVQLGRDELLAALAGLVKAVVALLVTFSIPIDAKWETFVLTVLSIVGAAFTRTQVTAKVNDKGVPVAKYGNAITG